MIYCVMLAGISLNETVRNLLFNKAQEMFQKKESSCTIAEDECEGYIQTDWQYESIGGTSGVLFKSELETNRGKVDVTYIVRPCEVNNYDAEWLDGIPLNFSAN